MSDLEPILKYNMTDEEAKAYKIGLMWEKACNDEFPNERHARLKRNGDPRVKSNLYNHCIKFVREMKGLLPESEYSLFITAQLQILKTLKEGEVHALIGPQILCSPKAWKRWLVWKKYYDRKMAQHPVAEQLATTVNSAKTKAEIDSSYKFMMREFKNEPTFEKIEQRIKDLSLIRWLTNGTISPYYALLSPWVKRSVGNDVGNALKFDLSSYSITTEISEYFKNKFEYEHV